jgi:hypothetical protein
MPQTELLTPDETSDSMTNIVMLREGLLMSDMKVCRKCLREMPMEMFTITDPVRGYRKARCKQCENERVRAYYASNPQYRETRIKAARLQTKTASQGRKHRLKSVYKMTPEQYDELLASQENCCALCGVEKVGNTRWKAEYFHIDHDHEQGHVRGILCQKCNVRIGALEGLMRDVGLDVALAYLKRPSPIVAAVVETIEYRVASEPPPMKVRTSRERGSCRVQGCSGSDQNAGYCAMHYARVLRNGEVGPVGALVRTGVQGASHPKSKLTDEDVIAIRASSEKGIRLAEKYGVTATLISNIRKGKVWTHLGTDSAIEGRERQTLTEADVRAIRESSLGPSALAREYGVSAPTIIDIRKRRSWRHVA